MAFTYEEIERVRITQRAMNAMGLILPTFTPVEVAKGWVETEHNITLLVDANGMTARKQRDL